MKKKRKMPTTAEDAFIREVTEDLKNENMQLLWKKYGVYITAVIIVILTIAVSFETIKAWRIKGYQKWSDNYSIAVSLQNQGLYNESLSILETIQNGSHIYADMAKLQISNIYFEKEEYEKAIEKLEEIVKNKKVNKELHNVAAIKLATYKLDSAPAEEIKDLLEPLAEKESMWTPVANELLALLAIREGELEKAAGIYEEILSSGKIDENLKNRVKDMLSVLNSENK